MTHSLLAFNTNEIKITPGQVTFNGFEDLKHQASVLAEEIKKVEVTDENLQTSKKMLAAVNKRVKEISDKRIAIKKEMLQPYNAFENQVKEITNIVKDADNFVREQVKNLEEQERANKEKAIQDIFTKRIKHYSFNDLFTFDDFIQPKHLNKSTSMKSVETEMVEWLEKKDTDFQFIQGLPNNHEVLMEYKDTKDLAVAINNVKQHEEYRKKLQQVVPKKKAQVEQEFIITLNDEKDLKLVELFMNQNEINYNLQKVAK